MTDLLSQLRDMKAPSREMDEAIWTATTPGASVKRWSYVHTATGKVCEVDEPRIDGGRITEVPKYTASLDCAIALVERLLPGRSIMMGWRQTSETRPWARVGLWPDPDATGATPAIALVIAALSALSAINRRAE